MVVTSWSKLLGPANLLKLVHPWSDCACILYIYILHICIMHSYFYTCTCYIYICICRRVCIHNLIHANIGVLQKNQCFVDVTVVAAFDRHCGRDPGHSMIFCVKLLFGSVLIKSDDIFFVLSSSKYTFNPMTNAFSIASSMMYDFPLLFSSYFHRFQFMKGQLPDNGWSFRDCLQ